MRPGAAELPAGSDVSLAEMVLHVLPQPGRASLFLSSLVTVAGSASVLVTCTSSIHQPSSPGLGLKVKRCSHVSHEPDFKSVWRNRKRIRRPRKRSRLNRGSTQVPMPSEPRIPGPSLARPRLDSLNDRNVSPWWTKLNSGMQVEDGPRRRSGSVGSKKSSSVLPSSIGSNMQLK